jgi:uncharacterized protein (UPF0216 family)
MSEKLLDLIWNLDIEKMNDHLPVERKTLAHLLLQEKPVVYLKNKKPHKIKHKDLQKIAQLIPENEWEYVKLPIILLRRTSMDKGLYSISGGKREIYIIFKLANKKTQSFTEFMLEDNVKPYLWKPEAFRAVSEATSVVIIGYS